MENWQSEFLQLIWQVAGLSFLWYVGSPQSREEHDRQEEKNTNCRRHTEDYLGKMQHVQFNNIHTYLLAFEDTAECVRACVHLRYAKKLYILQSLFTRSLHLALLWRQLPFMKYSRCGAPSRSVTVLSCSFFGAPEPVRGCTAFLKLKAMQNSYCCCNNAARTAHTGRSISL
jgi:hypothetical protein